MDRHRKPTAQLPAFLILVLLATAATAAYLYWLYSPGLVLWNPDFLAFLANVPPSRFFPPLYYALVECLGGSIAAGRVLSAAGLTLSVGAVMVAALRNTRTALPLGALGLMLLLSAPHAFVTTLSPSVDSLYTGVAIVALVTLSLLVMPPGHPQVLPARILVLQTALCLLFLLRYHGQALVVALCLVMALLGASRKVRATGWVLAALFLFGLAAGGWAGRQTAREQIWCGLEFRYHRLAEHGVLDGRPRGLDANGYIWDQYDRIIQTAREYSTSDHYTAAEIAVHVADNYYHYLRRPLVLLGLALFAMGGWTVWRRRDRYLFALFLVLYPVTLSLAYYTARASLLTEVAGLYLGLQVLGDLALGAPQARRAFACGTAALLTLLALATSYPRLSYEMRDWRRQLTEAKAVQAVRSVRRIRTALVWTEDPGITIVHQGPPDWFILVRAYHSWLDYSNSGGGLAWHLQVVPPEEILTETWTPRLLLIRDPALAAQFLTTERWEYAAEETLPQLHLLVQRRRRDSSARPTQAPQPEIR